MNKNSVLPSSTENPIINKQGMLSFYPDFLATNDANDFYNSLLTHLAWSEEHIQMFGKSVKVPRLVCWYGDRNSVYRYSGVEHLPQPWTETLSGLKDKIETFTQHSFNSVLGNLYRDGSDSMGWHSDDEKELGQHPFIASLSLGENRIFKVRHKSSKEQYKLLLPHGSLLIMSGSFQQYWQHCIPKTSTPVASRINLTFRTIKI